MVLGERKRFGLLLDVKSLIFFINPMYLTASFHTFSCMGSHGGGLYTLHETRDASPSLPYPFLINYNHNYVEKERERKEKRK